MLARTSSRVRDRLAGAPGRRASRRRIALGRTFLVALLAGAGLALSVLPAGADSSIPIRPSAEAWYRPLPLPVEVPPVPCAPVAGCVVPPVTLPATSPYPEKTLHVGASAGAEEARTYVSLDIASLPFGATVTSGTLQLPVLEDAAAGTLAPETASIRLCLATVAVQDGVDGSLGGAPTVDCTINSKARYVAASGSTPAQFTADLKPFVAAIVAGQSSFAVMPLTEAGDAAAWHVAFSRRDRTGGQPISASLEIAGSGPVDVPTDRGGPLDGGLDSGGVPPIGTGSIPGFSAPGTPPGGVQPPQTLPTQPARPQAVPVSATFAQPFAYPGVFLLPLVLLAALGWAARAMTRELVPART